ncbi:MAG: D-glycero-alpha-D-manno-heptose-1,7-bisphosphate 7-phosphatase [Candidatus Omnitrophota bacterium]
MTKILFLDRDGVINRFPGMGFYVTRQKDFHFLPNALRALGFLTRAGYELNVISNQGCVARKLITRAGLDRLTQRMKRIVEKKGGRLRVFYCTHQQSDDCACKKPKTKLFKKAIRGRKIDLRAAYFIGDSEEDVMAGKGLGCKTVLVLSGRNKRRDVGKFSVKPDFIKKDLWEAARWIIRKK